MEEETFIKVYDWVMQGNTATEALCYSLILSCCDGGEKYSGGIGYIAKRLNISKKTAASALNKLVEKGLLKKGYIEKDKVTYCVFWIDDVSAEITEQ